MKNLNQQESGDKEKEEFFNMYPLPEGFETKAERAWELKQIVSKIYNNNEKYKKLTNFTDMLEKKYSSDSKKGVGKCYLFQMVIGGSHEKTSFFDFDGEHSIEKFLMTFEL